MLTYLFLGLVFLFAGFVQGLTGFGSALVAIPLLCLLIDIKQAVPLCALNGLVISLILYIQLKKFADRKKYMPLFLGSIPGIILGATLLKSFDSQLIRMLLGVLLIGYSIYSLFALSPRQKELWRGWAWVTGFVSGAIGAAFSAGGPPTIIYTTLNGWSKDEIKATLSATFFFSAFLIVSAHAVGGLTDGRVLLSFLVTSPFVLLGTFCGSKLYKYLPGENYARLIYLFLIVMGGMLLLG